MTAYANSYFLLSLDIEDYRWFGVGGTIIQLVLLVFVSGKVVVTGAKLREDIVTAYDKIYPVLLEYKK